MELVVPFMNSSVSSASAARVPVRGHACVLCQQRKVKCSRETPCSGCIKSRAECVYRDPAPPRRRKRRSPEDVLLARLKRYEELLQSAGIKVDPVHSANEAAAEDDQLDEREPGHTSALDTASRIEAGEYDMSGSNPFGEGLSTDSGNDGSTNPGQFISEAGRSRYLENAMWADLKDELRSIPLPEDEVIVEAPQMKLYRMRPEDNDLLLGAPTKVNIANLHPELGQILQLWHVFLSNVNPLTHIIHVPTMQQSISDACDGGMQGISRGLEAFMFAMYLSSVISLSESGCSTMFSEARETLISKYWFGSRQSLVNSLWLRSSELMVLQALVLLLVSTSQKYDPRTLWSLTGIALRIGQRIGLHRDGASLGLPALDTEVRRRLWWQILVLDKRMAELSGSGFSILASPSDTKMPLNVNDSDLRPGVTEPPTPYVGATEMIFCLLRYEFGRFAPGPRFRPRGLTSTFDGIWQPLTASEISIAERDQAINELPEMLEKQYLRFCDPLNPLHFLAGAMTRVVLATMAFKVHHPRGRRGQNLPTEELEMLFRSSLKIIEYHNLGYSQQSVQHFLWNIKCYFVWDPFIYLLTELQQRTTGDDAEQAWQQVEATYHYNREFLTMRSPLHDAVATLAERAWSAREVVLARQQGVSPAAVTPPTFITVLRSRRVPPVTEMTTETTADSYQILHHPVSQQRPLSAPDDVLDPQYPHQPVQSSPIDWVAWDNMIEEFELNSGGGPYGMPT